MPWSLIVAGGAGAIAGLFAALIRDEKLKQLRVVVMVVLFVAINVPAQKYIAKPLIVDRELQSNRAFAAIKTHEPATYNAMRAELITAMQNGADAKDVRARVHVSVLSLVKKNLSRCSDKALVRYIRVTTDEIEELAKNSPEHAFNFLFPKPGAYFDVAPLLSEATRKEDLDALADVIATGAGATPPKIDHLKATAMLQAVVEDVGPDRVQQLADPNAAGLDKAQLCATTADLYRHVLALDEADAALVLRMMFENAA